MCLRGQKSHWTMLPWRSQKIHTGNQAPVDAKDTHIEPLTKSIASIANLGFEHHFSGCYTS